MTSDTPRREGVLGQLAAYGPDVDRLCAGCLTRLPGIKGMGLAVMTTLPARGARFVSDPTSARIEELQFTLGEGPCVDAFSQGHPVLAADLTLREHRLRWPAFTEGAVAAGVLAVFALPLCIGAIRLGVIDLYRDTPGPLTDGELSEALVFADTAALLLLAEDHGDGALWTEQAENGYQAVVHQATGMVMAQLRSTVPEAFVRLRAYAYAQERSVVDVARDVVNRRLRFDDQGV